MVLSEKYTQKKLGMNFLKRFYLSRFFRLYPIYLFIAISSIILSITTNYIHLPEKLNPYSLSDVSNPFFILLNWIPNIIMFFLNLPSSDSLLIMPAWSLGVEIAFYAIAPFVLKFESRWLLVLSFVGIFLQLIPYGHHAPLLFGIHFFILGALARRYRYVIESFFCIFSRPNLIFLFAISVLMVFFAIPHRFNFGTEVSHAYNSLDTFLYPLLTAFLIPLLHESTKSNKFDQWVGQLSYPFYLVHLLILETFNSLGCSDKISLMFIISLGVSVILFQLEARFIEPWRASFGRS